MSRDLKRTGLNPAPTLSIPVCKGVVYPLPAFFVVGMQTEGPMSALWE